jgi:ATP-dependent DNA helicase RecG
MNRSELERTLSDLESDRVELTISLTDFDKFSEAICSFANDLPNSGKPGYLFIGATRHGRASGAVITDELLQRLGAIRSDGNIQPLPVMNVEKWPLGGGEMVVVEVFPSDLPPARYRGHTCIRVGPRRAQASPAEERILSERRIDRARTWDSRVCGEATLDDLALDLFTLTYRLNAVAYDVVEENDRPLDLQLASLRFYDLKADHPTNVGVLLFGKDPMSFFPGAYVQYVQYSGGSQADEVLQERRIVGDLLDVLRDLNRLALEIAEERPVQRSDLSEAAVFDYPPKGMRELFMNAVIHRNYEESTTPIQINHYSDRIEIQNSGGLYGDLTPEQFPRGTAYRNPILAEAAKVLGFVNRFGRGISLAQREFERNGSPPAQFDPRSNFFLATVWRRP